ncbi:helix-turn-helix transcriptional regulator [Chitinophaga sp. Cy-1792]|uniref:helix-turn-helix domain-containing protein n=1 Tax=Chitinophaga sp. Cy-1792 TaxID=2608339 RepID=UPI00142329D8|nr:helix-turn-helix transcriptional regulator [Chitinophaga sp. Cy-1792]NIG56646.1 helix-turn-helix transcriptional regulator [Chitinophaga sp. Cy-1792]
MKDRARLNEILLQQHFVDAADETALHNAILVAQMYAQVENAISVLSDMKENRSYIYTGGAGEELGIPAHREAKVIDSIWEEEIFSRIRPADLLEKYSLEHQYFQFLKSIPVAERSAWQVQSRMQMRGKTGAFVPVQHRIFYLSSTIHGTVQLALCLYNIGSVHTEHPGYHGAIINTRTGKLVPVDDPEGNEFLTRRELAVLKLIKDGKRSREIADILSISLFTVNRHRQNILEKLHVSNSMEACRIAESILLI